MTDKYFYSKGTRIANIAAFVYALVVDEKIVANTLASKGFEITSTGSSESDLQTNIINHIDIISNKGSERYAIDVKTPTERYIDIAKHCLQSETNKSTHIAIIYNEKVFITKTSIVKALAKPSLYNKNMYYIRISDFIANQTLAISLSDEDIAYRTAQYANYMQLKKDIDVENIYNMQTCINAFLPEYKNRFNADLEFIPLQGIY